MVDETLYSDNARNFLLQRRNGSEGWPAVIRDIGNVAGEYIRSSDSPDARNLTGRARAPQPYIKVGWAWLVLPIILVVLAVVFLGLTAMQSKEKPYLYKSSALAATLLGLEGWSADEMGGEGKRETDNDLEERTTGIEARLVRGEDGGLRLMRQQ